HPVHGAPRHGAPHPPPEEVQAARAAGLLGGLLYASGGLALLFGVLFGVGAGLMAAGVLDAPERIPRVGGTALGALVAGAGLMLLGARAKRRRPWVFWTASRCTARSSWAVWPSPWPSGSSRSRGRC